MSPVPEDGREVVFDKMEIPYVRQLPSGSLVPSILHGVGHSEMLLAVTFGAT